MKKTMNNQTTKKTMDQTQSNQAKNMFHYPSCFSGECGICLNCCGNVSLNNSQKSETMLTQRSKTFAKFYRNRAEDDQKEYADNIKSLYKRYDYCGSNDLELLPQRYKLRTMFDRDPTFYTIDKSLTKDRCHMNCCQINYENTHDHLKRYMDQIPVYKGPHCTLCLSCANNLGEASRIETRIATF